MTSRDVRSPGPPGYQSPSSSVEDTEPSSRYYPTQESDEFSWCCSNTEHHKSTLVVKDHTVLSGRWV